MRLSIFNRHPRAELSAYLDGELIPLRIEAMRSHLASCPSCRAELEALRKLKAGLAALPEIDAPRSFALTPEMASRPLPQRAPLTMPVRAMAMANGMRLAGAGMTIALVLVLVLDFTGSGTKSGSTSSADNVQFAAEQDSNSLSSAGGNAAAPAPAPAHNDLRDGSPPTSPPPETPLPGGLSSDSGHIAGLPATPGVAQVPVGGEPSPTILQTDESPPADKRAAGITEASASNAPAAYNAQPSAFSTLQPAAASTGSGHGVDVLLIVALALAASIVLTVTASFVLPRFGRDDV
jgi:hypothetical protein